LSLILSFDVNAALDRYAYEDLVVCGSYWSIVIIKCLEPNSEVRAVTEP